MQPARLAKASCDRLGRLDAPSPLTQQVLQSVKIDVDDRGREQRQKLRENQTTDDRVARLANLPSGSGCRASEARRQAMPPLWSSEWDGTSISLVVVDALCIDECEVVTTSSRAFGMRFTSRLKISRSPASTIKYGFRTLNSILLRAAGTSEK